jgi:putative hydrolase of the HAD superfamily
MIRVVAFDLDNTLYDATTIPREMLAPAIEAVRSANRARNGVPPEVLEAAIVSARRLGFLQVAEQHGLPDWLRAAWREVYQGLRVTTPLSPYPDVLPCLRALDCTRVLLTTGFRGMQESKIAALAIAPLFHAIYIDSLDDGPGPGKQRLLAEMLETYGCGPRELLVIGDSPENEIAAGNALGAVTVQMLRPGIVYSGTAQYHLTTLAELPRLLTTL